jgi:arylsulfatase
LASRICQVSRFAKGFGAIAVKTFSGSESFGGKTDLPTSSNRQVDWLAGEVDVQILFMKVIIFLLAAVVFCGSAAFAQSGGSGARPNIVVILADDMGFSDLGCYGSEIPTPHLDKLAAEGLRFSQFYNTPRCCPSRAALLTGLYPQEAGVGAMMEDRGIPGYRGELNHKCVTIAEVLREAGYKTLMVGKWHLNHIFFDGKKQLNFETNEPFWENKNGWPLQRGFEDYYGTIHGVSSYYDPFSLVRNNTPVRPGANFYYTDAISEHAVSDIRKFGGGGAPFFLYVAYTAPHWPMQAPPEDIARNRQTYMAGWDAIRTNRYLREIGLGLIEPDWRLSPRDDRVKPWENIGDKEWQANRMATYAAMVERLDSGIGRILDALKEKRIEQNTLVLFLSDNGACAEVIQPDFYDVPSRTRDGRPIHVGNVPSIWAGAEDVWQSYGVPWANVSDTPFRLYKHFTHEGGISTPFIVSWPAVVDGHGKITRQMGHITDIMATCLDVAGVSYPKAYQGHSILPMEGRSLLPVFEGKTREVRPLFWEHEGNRAMHMGEWKLVSRYPGNWELYDTSVDRTELTNQAGARPEKVRELSAMYEAWANRCGIVPPDKLPPTRKIIPAKPGGENGFRDDPD